MPNILELNKQFQDRLRNREEEAANRIQIRYFDTYRSLVQDFEVVAGIIANLQKQNKRLSRARIFQATRLSSVIGQLADEIESFNSFATTEISSSQREVARFAISDSSQLIKAAMGTIPSEVNFDAAFLRFDNKAAEQMVSRFQDDSPIRKILEASVGDQIEKVENVFIKAIINGLPARNVTTELYKTFGLSYIRAETTARTNIVSAYRDGNLERFNESKAVKGWQWSATLDERTCPVCIVLDGQVFGLDVPFATHPVCRCSPLPVTFTWEELGISAREFKPDLGPRGLDWFEAQPESIKKHILKRDKYKLYSQGKLKLEDLVHYFVHDKYGPSREEYSIIALKRLKVLN